jgi:hypothetical protein
MTLNDHKSTTDWSSADEVDRRRRNYRLVDDKEQEYRRHATIQPRSVYTDHEKPQSDWQVCWLARSDVHHTEHDRRR